MATPLDCCNPCPTSTPPVNIPGVAGNQGTAGINGINGVDAFSILVTDMTVPPDLVTPVTITVTSSVWMVEGQTLIIGQGAGVAILHQGPGTFVVTGVPTPTTVILLFKHYSTDVAFGQPISAGAVISASGPLATTPIGVADGGTGGTTRGTAQVGLGLGQAAIVSTSSGLTQAINTVATQVGTIDIQVTAAGLWLWRGSIRIKQDSPTFAADRIVTLRLKNITQVANIKDVPYFIPAGTTADAVSPQLEVFVTDATAVVNDHLQLQIFSDGGTPVNSGGVFQLNDADLVAIPLRLS